MFPFILKTVFIIAVEGHYFYNPANQVTPELNSEIPALIGGDRDAHGCIGSAGYAWCGYTGQCERPWILASQADFENTQENFDRYCSKNKQ